MVVRHLTDDEAQIYLDGSARDLAPDLRDHLETCTICQEAVQTYRAVYARLADDTSFEGPPDLAVGVIARLGLKVHRRRLSLPADIVVVACAMVSMVIVAFAFLDLSQFIECGTQSLESVHSFLVGLNHTLTLAIAGVAILIFMGALDLAFRPRKLVQ